MTVCPDCGETLSSYRAVGAHRRWAHPGVAAAERAERRGSHAERRETVALLNREAREWMHGAACASVDPDLFFPERGASTAPAKAVCRDCPIRLACLDYAIAQNILHGIWGGCSERERRRIRRQRAHAAHVEREARTSTTKGHQ